MSPVRKRTAAEPAPAAKAADAKKAKTASAAKPAKASSAPQRASQRERKAVSYKEEDLVEAAERPKPGSYVPPRDPKGMKSTAYNCKYPAAPAPVAKVLPTRAPLPKRNDKGELVFVDFPHFRPNLTPAEVLKDGAFGGTYYRPIKSSVTGESYKDQHKEFPADWLKGVPEKALTATTYSATVNKWKAECGGALDMWESSGWISNIDPYGWFQWYCRFYLGRRSTDDERQISRMMGVAGPKGRFRNQLINKIAAARALFDDPRVSPVIRQTLHHWAYCLTEKDYIRAMK